MFFKSPAHKLRFLTAMKQQGKIFDGRLDPEYGAALYILTAEKGIWERVQPYIARNSILIDTILENVDLSHGYNVLIRLAANLFNEHMAHVDPVDFVILDDGNFSIAITALQIRRYPPLLTDLTKEEHMP